MPFFVAGLYKFMGKLADRIIFWCPGPTGVRLGVPFLADRTFFGVQGPRGLGLECRSLRLAFKSLREN